MSDTPALILSSQLFGHLKSEREKGIAIHRNQLLSQLVGSANSSDREMSTKACASCLRTLQQQSRAVRDLPRPTRRNNLRVASFRPFTTTSSRFVQIPPVSPGTASTSSNTSVNTEASPDKNEPRSFNTKKAAAALRRATSGVTETYTAYGVTEDMYRECSKQADYSIPQAADYNAEMPKTEDGEDLGVGSGWWYNGMLCY